MLYVSTLAVIHWTTELTYLTRFDRPKCTSVGDLVVCTVSLIPVTFVRLQHLVSRPSWEVALHATKQCHAARGEILLFTTLG